MCGATSLKIIKYKTLPYNISNHSIYKFISSKKKKVKDTVIQHNSSFSFLLSTSLKRNSRSRKHSGETLPTWGAPEELKSPSSVWGLSAQSHSCKDIWMWKILGTLFLWRPSECETSRSNFPTSGYLPQDPAPSGPGNFLSQKVPIPPSMPQPFGVLLNQMAYNISLVSQKPENNSLFLSGSEHIRPLKLQATGLAWKSSLKAARAPVLSSPGHCQWGWSVRG